MNGGTEIQTLSLIQALIGAGHTPLIACYFEWNEQMMMRFQHAGAKVYLFSKDRERPKGILNTIKFLRRNFKKVIKEEKPDIAHIQYMTPGALSSLVLKSLGIKKILATSHTDANIYGKKGLRLIRFLTNHILSGFQTITLNAERGYFGEASLFNGNLKKHFTIYNSLPSHILIRETPKTFSETITIGAVSRLEKIKGMDLVIPAFAQVLEKLSSQNSSNFVNSQNFSNCPKVKLLIVGDGSLKSLMENQVKEMELNDMVTFTGRKPQIELQNFYDQIDILLMPSRSEGFGLTAIEGMARGCIPVVANTGGLPEVVTKNSGILHNTDDIDDLSEKIINLINNPHQLTYMSKNAIKKAKMFSFNIYSKNIKRWYNQLF